MIEVVVQDSAGQRIHQILEAYAPILEKRRL